MASKVARVLVPVTGAAMDDDAIALACDLARAAKGTVLVLYVIQVSRSLPLDAEVPDETAHGEQVLQRMEKLGKSYKCKIEGEILQARDLGPAVVQEAVQRDIDVIVTAAEYAEHFGSPTLGEVVPYLLKFSPCRVLVYREEQQARVEAEARR